MKSHTDVDARVIKALAHPLRVRILAVLEQRAASPSEIAEELGAPLGNVSYHVRQLAALKLIRLIRRTPRRGAIEHHYKADTRPQISDAGWAEVPEIVKQAMIGAALQNISSKVNASAGAGGFSRAEAHLSRTQLLLDSEGWEEVAKELRGVVDRIDHIAERASERLADGNHADEQPGTVAMMFFEDVEPEPAEATPRKPARKRARSAASNSQ
jgi:DNA-binding transcriptional ArsR family regulator